VWWERRERERERGTKRIEGKNNRRKEVEGRN
jgi:hypothetical protein